MVMISSVDAIGSYGSVKEMITVHSVTSLALRGDPSRVHSWFPGYGIFFSWFSKIHVDWLSSFFFCCRYIWTIALCAACESNIGWLFRADKKNLHPKSFWGIRTSQISDDTQSRQV